MSSRENPNIDELIRGLMSQVETKPKDIEEAVEEFFELYEGTWAAETERQYRVRMMRFVEYCDEKLEVYSMHEIEPENLANFRHHLEDEGYAGKTVQDNLKILRQFARFAKNHRWLPPFVEAYIRIPSLHDKQEIRDETMEYEVVEAALEKLEKYQYASAEHMTLLLVAKTGLRIGSIHSLDVGDFKKQPYRLTLEHRPKEGTRLKNGRDSEREIRLSEETATVIEDYIESVRPSVEDDYGRSPLMASEKGRMAKSTYRRYIYRWTQPCRLGFECPGNCSGEEATDVETLDAASRCPGSKSPHAVRAGYISHLEGEGVPLQDIAKRCDVSPEIIEKHYSNVDETKKADNRFDRIQENLSDEE